MGYHGWWSILTDIEDDFNEYVISQTILYMLSLQTLEELILKLNKKKTF